MVLGLSETVLGITEPSEVFVNFTVVVVMEAGSIASENTTTTLVDVAMPVAEIAGVRLVIVGFITSAIAVVNVESLVEPEHYQQGLCIQMHLLLHAVCKRQMILRTQLDLL